MSFPFSSRTLAALITGINAGYSKANIGTLLLSVEADAWEPKRAPNKETLLQETLKAMRDSGGERAQKAALELAGKVLAAGKDDGLFDPEASWYAPLRDALAADGWEFDPENDRLVSAMPAIAVAEETSLLEGKLTELGFPNAAGHYRQALDAFSRGDWAAANSQIRSLLEDLLPGLAERVEGKRPREVRAALDKLTAKDFLIEGEYSLLRGLWDAAQPRGSHAGLSDAAEARFRLMVTTAQCRFLLERLES